MRTLRILVADDTVEDVELLKVACSRAGVNAPFHFVQNGRLAVEYLKGEGAFSDRAEYPLPTVLLLDLKMPILDGFGVLEWLRTQEGLRRMRVVVFTSSEERRDVNRAYELGANSYLVKPTDFMELQELVRLLANYWKANLRPDCE